MDGSNAGLTKLSRRRIIHSDYSFSEGDVREAFKRVFSPDANYVLLQTIANQEAVDVLRQYVASRNNMASPWEIRRVPQREESRDISDSSEGKSRLKFGNGLMDSYLGAIDKIAEQKVGVKNYAHYPMVSTNGVHSLDRDPNAIFWPRIYFVNAEKQEKLEGIIDNLSGDEGFRVLRRLESPQFYMMAEIETLHNLGIPPIVRLPNELRVGARELSNYVDFLAQMSEKYVCSGPIMDD